MRHPWQLQTEIEKRQAADAKNDRKRHAYMRRMEELRWAGADLPILPFVPHIVLTPRSKYRMEASHVIR